MTTPAPPRSPLPKSEPAKGFRRFVYKLQNGGFAWIFRRLRSECVLPTTGIGKTLHAMVRGTISVGLAPMRLFRRNEGVFSKSQSKKLYAFYDLMVEPITYDFVWFLAGADLVRRTKKLESIHIIIVPGPDMGVREEDVAYERVVDRDARKWRVFNILVAAAALLPKCSGLTVTSSRREAAAFRSVKGGAYYPHGYEPSLPVAHHPNDCLIPARKGLRPIGVLRATKTGLRYVDQFIENFSKGRRLITITIRDYAYGSDRNSNIGVWADFAARLNPSTWWPLFVLDTERTIDPLPSRLQGFEVMREVSWNVQLRMALYERAWLNMGVNNGPLGLCWLNDQTRYLTFKIVTPTVSQTTVEFNRSRGFEPDTSLPFATRFQKWVWEDDTLEVIQREFDAMVTLIEADEQRQVSSLPKPFSKD